MKQTESIAKLAPALLRAQRNMGAAVKDAKNPFFKSKYADLNSVREASHPALNVEGIMVLQPIVTLEGKNYVETVLLHESGEQISSLTEIISAKQNDPQAYGSAISYSRRYGLQSLLSLGTEDNDAEGAMNRSTPAKITTATVSTLAAPPPAASVGSFKKASNAVKANDGWDDL